MTLSLTEAARRAGREVAELRAAIVAGQLAATPRGRGFLISEDALSEAFPEVTAEVVGPDGAAAQPAPETVQEPTGTVAAGNAHSPSGQADGPAQLADPEATDQPAGSQALEQAAVSEASSMPAAVVAAMQPAPRPEAPAVPTAGAVEAPDPAAVLSALVRQQDLTRELSMQLAELVALFERVLPALVVQPATAPDGASEQAGKPEDTPADVVPTRAPDVPEVLASRTDDPAGATPVPEGAAMSSDAEDAVPRRLTETRARLVQARVLLRGYGLSA